MVCIFISLLSGMDGIYSFTRNDCYMTHMNFNNTDYVCTVRYVLVSRVLNC
jgi:hypothetical protein